jgi:hypothetical protein
MDIVVDANILLRYVSFGHPQQPIAVAAMANLELGGHRLCDVPQSLYEFWVVSTRPISVNGLGLTTPVAEKLIQDFHGMFSLLPDTPAIYPEWFRLVSQHSVLGKPAHDARIVAAMNVRALTHILTFNVSDFQRYPAIVALDPVAVASGNLP